jgi:hypothetical protein
MPKSSKKFVIVSNKVNNYGYRYDTTGIDITQYKKNPVMLYMHERGKAIGHMQDVQLEDNGDITGYPFFSDKDDFAMKIYHQVEEGTLNMCSSGIEPIKVSDAPEYLQPGQILATVIKGKLKETSIVDIGGDDNALALYHDGEMLLLSDAGTTDISHIIPSIQNHNNNNMKEQLIPMLLLVGLSKDGTPDQLMQKLQELKEKADKSDEHAATIITLNDTIGTLQKAAQDAEVEAVLDGAVVARKITAEQKPIYKQIGSADIGNLKKLFDTMPTMPTLADQLAGGAGDESDPILKLSYKEAHRNGKLATIKTKYPERYNMIFKEHFGRDPQA